MSNTLGTLVEAFVGRVACISRHGRGRVLLVQPPVNTESLRRTSLGIALVVVVLAMSTSTLIQSAEPQRLWCVSERAWIYRKPSREQAPIGSLLRGDAVVLRASERLKGSGCPGGFYEVEPRGFVCDDFAVTTQASARSVRGLKRLRRKDGAFPFRFAISDWTPLYRRIPTDDEISRVEGPLGPPGRQRKLHPGHRGHERLAERRKVLGRDPVPFFLRRRGSLKQRSVADPLYKLAPPGSTLAYAGAFDVGNRTWMLGVDGSVFPADRVRPFRRSRFRGVALGAPFQLPLAWLRDKAAPRWRRAGATFRKQGADWAIRSAVFLKADSEPVLWEGQRYWETRECAATGGCSWIAERDATLVRKLNRMWWGGAEERSVVVSITRGTLVAYEGRRPVFTTLVSPGVGGVPRKGVDPVRASTTPLGVYRVTYKVRHTTMSPEEGDPQNFWMAEVPHTQYFNMPFAIHAAYWHEDFGKPMSAGCINLSPLDAEWLFAWTKPSVPETWGGATTSKEQGVGSFVVVIR